MRTAVFEMRHYVFEQLRKMNLMALTVMHLSAAIPGDYPGEPQAFAQGRLQTPPTQN